ncbi:MAG TPA: acylphosphatase [Burkholderiales bacterium]|nr:acylphosphatase [Burkholderiales bacterium]
MAIHLLIHGVVQAVGFRESMRIEAERLGITGWVRNRRDHTVEAVIDGEPAALDAMLAWAKRGPRQAIVDRIETHDIEGGFDSFERRPTV